MRHLTGSFATAGVVAGAFAASLGVGGPLLGRLVDRRGQTKVLLAGALVAGAALAGIAALPARAPDEALVALAVVLGLGMPPVDACLRAILPAAISDREARRAAYAAESAAIELTWIVGPPLVLFVGVVSSTSAALVVAGAVLVAGTAVFAAQPASRAWRPASAPERPRGGSLRAPAMRTLVLLLVFVGVVFGTVEVAVIAAVAGLGSPAAAGLLADAAGADAAGAAAAFAVAGAAGTVAALIAALRARPLNVPSHPAAVPAAA